MNHTPFTRVVEVEGTQLLLVDCSTPEALAAEQEVRDLLAAALAGMPRGMGEAVALRYGLDRGHPRTWAEVGALIGADAHKARRLVLRALHVLRKKLHFFHTYPFTLY